jgi:hypothetical protein
LLSGDIKGLFQYVQHDLDPVFAQNQILLVASRAPPILMASGRMACASHFLHNNQEIYSGGSHIQRDPVLSDNINFSLFHEELCLCISLSDWGSTEVNRRPLTPK